MSFITRYERQLLDAAHRRRRRGPGVRTLLVAAVAGLAVTSSALAATGVWRPWADEEGERRPTVTADAPPERQLDLLGVLRRDQTQADRSAAEEGVLRYLGKGVTGVRSDFIRRLGPGGAVLVPVAGYNQQPPDLPQAPDALKRMFAPGRDGLCVFVGEPNGDGGGFECLSTAQVSTGYLPPSLGPRMYGLVPDEVVRVNIRLEGGASVTAPVRDNFFSVSVSRNPADPAPVAAAPRELRWLDPSGRVLRVVSGDAS